MSDGEQHYDLIGDIHGYADQLEGLLRHLGHALDRGEYQHPERRAVFVGDFIDRGPKQARTLEIVRPMIDSGNALAVMGNHEFNAICYATPAGSGYIRPHTDKNDSQHADFLREFPLGSAQHTEAIAWFRTLPLFLDLAEFGVVHACWSPSDFAKLSPFLSPTNVAHGELFARYQLNDGGVYNSVERILKGPEHTLPEQLSFNDKDGHTRHAARVRWWVSDDRPAAERLEFGGAQLSDEQHESLFKCTDIEVLPYPPKPIFVGHYWLRGAPAALSPHVACIDYSVAKHGKLVAYRWSGEATIQPEHFAWEG